MDAEELEKLLTLLKFYLQEDEFPYFDDDKLIYMSSLYSNPLLAAYQGCLIKASDDSFKLGPISIASNSKYWMMRANQLYKEYMAELRAEALKNGTSGAFRLLQRVDE